MKHKITQFLKYIIFLLLGLLLFWFVYKDQDIDHIREVLRSEVDYRWIIISICMALMSHVFRAIRWNLVLDTKEKKSNRINSFFSVMIGYMMNLVLPRMGEVTRCGTMAKYEERSFSEVMGTVVSERIVDGVMLLIFTSATILLQFDEIINFVRNNPALLEKATNILTSPGIFILVILGIIGFYVMQKRLPKAKTQNKIVKLFNDFKNGVKSILTMKHKGKYILYSVCIWMLYYLMGYVCFFCFEFSSSLTPLAGLTVFVLGSYGMVAPVQAGIGAWHFMTIEALALYGVAKPDGMIYALLMHTSINAMYLIVGVLCFILLPFFNTNPISNTTK